MPAWSSTGSSQVRAMREIVAIARAMFRISDRTKEKRKAAEAEGKMYKRIKDAIGDFNIMLAFLRDQATAEALRSEFELGGTA